MNNAFTTTSEVMDDGEYQIINLPEGFQFEGDEVWVQKIGDSVFLTSKADATTRKPETTD
jgi:virulence-associated protein VagC